MSQHRLACRMGGIKNIGIRDSGKFAFLTADFAPVELKNKKNIFCSNN